MRTKTELAAAAMCRADTKLYEKILDTPGFAFHFNAVVATGRNAERLLAEVEAFLRAEEGDLGIPEGVRLADKIRELLL